MVNAEGFIYRHRCDDSMNPRTPDSHSSRERLKDLLSEDVCVPAVLSKLPEHVEVHPAQRERAAPVAADCVVQPQGCRRAA